MSDGHIRPRFKATGTRRARWWLIRRLAHHDMLMLNVRVETALADLTLGDDFDPGLTYQADTGPGEVRIGRVHPEAKGLIRDCQFVGDGGEE